MKENIRIAVVGAGIAGLTCAYELQKAGHDVVVYEKESYVGGRMSTREKDGFPMDTGANHLANVYHHMRELVEELGLTWKPVEFLNYRIFHKKHTDTVETDHLFPLLQDLSWKTKLKLSIQGFFGTRNKTDFFDLSTAVKYDTDTAKNFSKKHLTGEGLDYVVDPFTSTYQFHRSDEISLGMVKAMIRSHYTNKGEWALHRLEGGMIALPQALADKLDVRLGVPVTKINGGEGEVKLTTKEGEEKFDAVVIASTADVTANIYTNATPGQRIVLQKTKYATTVGVAFKIPKDLLGEITIVWVPYVEGGKISGYTNEAMKGDSMIKNDKTLILTWFHEDFAKIIIDKSDEEIFEITKKELMKVCPFIKNESLLENHDLQRWPCAIPKHSQGHLTVVDTFLHEHQGENNVFFCGDYLNAPWTEGALQQGQRVAKSIIERIGV